MLHLALTTRVCSQMIEGLEERGWTIAKVARTIGASIEYVHRIRNRTQSFQLADVEALARAARRSPHELVFACLRRDRLSRELRGLYDIAHGELKRHESLRRALSSSPERARRKPAASAH